jgi:hypothetical protein
MTEISSENTKSLSLMRKELWFEHPILAARAVLPTPAVVATIAIVCKVGRSHRGSAAFWAHPLSGKTSCIRSMEQVLAQQFAGCGVFVYEAKKKQVCAEGAFLEDILTTMNYEARLQRSLSGKRDQTMRALYAYAAPRGHLFFLIDEAQEIHEQELCWLKTLINWLVNRDCRVTVVMFGQQELLAMREALVTKARSDLDARYTSELYEFENVMNAVDLKIALASCDTGSEYPVESGWSYTQFLWPQAFAHGFRLAEQAETAWTAFLKASPTTRCAQGISMRWVALTLAELAESTKDEDRRSFGVDEAIWSKAVERAGYIDRPAVPLKRGRRRRQA